MPTPPLLPAPAWAACINSPSSESSINKAPAGRWPAGAFCAKKPPRNRIFRRRGGNFLFWGLLQHVGPQLFGAFVGQLAGSDV